MIRYIIPHDTTYLLSFFPYGHFSSIVLVAMDWSSNLRYWNSYSGCVTGFVEWASWKICEMLCWRVHQSVCIRISESDVLFVRMYLYISKQIASGWSWGTTKARFTIAWSTFIFTWAKASDRKGACMMWRYVCKKVGDSQCLTIPIILISGIPNTFSTSAIWRTFIGPHASIRSSSSSPSNCGKCCNRK